MLERIRTEIIPTAVRAQAFGAKVKEFVSFEPNTDQAAYNFASEIAFGEVTLKTESGRLVTESIVVKTQYDSTHDKYFKGCHFHNEVLFYTQVVPFLRKYDTNDFLVRNVPEFIYGNATKGQDPRSDVIVLKNLKAKGFQMCEQKPFLDAAHIKLALGRLAEFHALSLKAARDDPQGFRDVISKIETPDLMPRSVSTPLRLRGVEPLKNDPKYKDRLGDIYEHCNSSTVWVDVLRRDTSGALNVIVHGDLTRNNIMFRYDADGQPEEVVFVDWGIFRHSSPVIDLSVLLTLHTSPEMKRTQWDDFLRVYLNALSRQLDKPAEPTFEALEREFREKGVYGYHLSLFLVPAAVQTVKKEELFSLDPESRNEFVLNIGGEEATEYLAAIVQHMLDRNYVFDH